MSFPLTKSHVSTCDPNNPAMMNLTLNKLFDRTKEEKYMTELINIETGQHTTNLAILDKGEKYARGLLTLGLEPGVDNIAVIGCATFEALAIFAAAAEIGCGFSHLFLHPPRSKQIVTQLPVIAPKVVIVGEGAGGCTFKALVSFFDADKETPTAERLPFVERIFYDSSYKDRSPSHKFIQTLDELIKLGEKVSDEQLLQAKLKVKPEFALQYLFTSGSTGAPKCATRSQAGFASLTEIDELPQEPTMIMNTSVDTLASYAIAVFILVGKIKKTIMIPESYEENPFTHQGEVLTQAIIDEQLGQLTITISALNAIVDHVKAHKLTLPCPLSIMYGGQIFSKHFVEEADKLIPGIHYPLYGMTEAPLITLGKFGDSPEEINARHQGLMYAAPGTKLRVVNEDNDVVDIGVAGEIEAHSPAAIVGYRNNEELSRALFTEDGFIKTGDLGVMREDGALKVKGRITSQERFKIFGKVEYAPPLEEIFNEHPDINQVYAVSAKVNEWIGDEITCCIKMMSADKQIPEEELLKFCSENGMYRRQRPARILYMNEFPMTDNLRKVSKLKLTAQVQAMVAEDEELGKCKWFSELEKTERTY